MPKKQLDTTTIVNELEHSAFFPPAASPGSPAPTPTPTPTPTPAPANQNVIFSQPPAEDPQQFQQPTQEPPMAPIVHTERNTRTVEPNGRTVETTLEAELPSTLLQEITQGVKTDKRPTERYSFEIYRDQIPQIEELQYLYKKRTGQKLPASRILREALEAYLHNAFEAMKRKK